MSHAWQLASVSSSAGISLNTLNQDRGEKMIHTTADSVLFDVLTDGCVAVRIGLVPARLSRSHILQCMRV